MADPAKEHPMRSEARRRHAPDARRQAGTAAQPSRLALVGFVAGAALLGACSSGSGPLVTLDVKTDYVPVVDFDRVEYSFEGPREARGERAARMGENFGGGVRVAELTNLPVGGYSVRVRLRKGMATVADQPAWLPLREHPRVHSMLVVFTRSCAGVVCPPASDPKATACEGGRCVRPECAVTSSREVSDCMAAECAVPEDCPAVAPCATRACVRGACVPDAPPCTGGRTCDPRTGCVDPTPLDSGMDMPAPDDAGPACTPVAETCNGLDDDCDGVVDDGACLWQWDDLAGLWQRRPIAMDAPHAPRSPIRAAVGINAARDALVFTDSDVHFLDLPTATWTGSEPLTSRFPDVAGRGITAAYSVELPRSPGVTSITIVLGRGPGVVSEFYEHEVDAGGRTDPELAQSGVIRHTGSGDEERTMATGPHAVDYRETKAMWVQLHNRWGFAPGTQGDACGDPSNADPIGPHGVHVSVAGLATLQNAGVCFHFFAPMPVAVFGPFTRSGAPDFRAWRTAAWSADALWLIP
jgi:hypothetical protein